MVNSVLQPTSNVHEHNIQLATLSKSDGSASYRHMSGPTVITSVNGPIEVRIRDEILGEATLELKVLPSSGLAGTHERYVEDLIRSTIRPSLLLGLHPRSLVQITSQILSSEDPSVAGPEIIAATINSITVACVDAGLSMKAMLSAAVVTGNTGSKHVVCYSYPKKELVTIESTGPFSRDELSNILATGLQLCDDVYESMESAIGEKLQKDNRWKAT